MWKMHKALILIASLTLIVGIAGASDYAFGTKVMDKDNDLGRLIKNIPSSASVSYWNMGPNPDAYDNEDIVYLDIQGDGKVDANDLRLSSYGIFPPGSKVKSIDNDINAPLKKLMAGIHFLNISGSGTFGLSDPIYVHQASENYLEPDKVDEKHTCDCSKNGNEGYRQQASYPGDCTNHPAGTYCAIYSDNYVWLIHDSPAGGVWDIADSYQGKRVEVIHGVKADYFHVIGTSLAKEAPRDGSSCNCPDKCPDHANKKPNCRTNYTANYLIATQEAIRTNDIRLNDIDQLAAGTKVKDLDPDQNILVGWPMLLSFPPSPGNSGALRFYDANGNGFCDYPDDIYVDISTGSEVDSGIVSVNNVRLSGPAY